MTDRPSPETVGLSSLITKLSAVMGEMDNIPKKGHNKAQNYDYVRETDVADAARKLLSKYHLFLHQSVVNHERHELYKTNSGNMMILTIAWVDFTWYDGDTGASLPPQTFIGYGADTGDKGIYKASTGSEKYALMKTFLISTGDDPEADEKVDRSVAAKGAATGPRVTRTDRAGSQRGGRPTQASNPQLAEVARLIRELKLDGPAMLSLIKAVLKVEVPAGDIKPFLTSLDPASLGTLISAMTAIEDAQSEADEEADTEVTGDIAPYDDGFAIA